MKIFKERGLGEALRRWKIKILQAGGSREEEISDLGGRRTFWIYI